MTSLSFIFVLIPSNDIRLFAADVPALWEKGSVRGSYLLPKQPHSTWLVRVCMILPALLAATSCFNHCFIAAPPVDIERHPEPCGGLFVYAANQTSFSRCWSCPSSNAIRPALLRGSGAASLDGGFNNGRSLTY